MRKLNKILAVVIILVIIAGWIITVGGAGDKVGSIKDYIKLGLDLQGGVYVVMEAQTDATGEELKSLMTQTQAVIEKRVNEMGLTNPIVTIEGENRIRVELPGADDAESAIDQIGKTAQLQFVLADGTVAVDGSNVKDAQAAVNQQGAGYVVTLEFNSEGATAFQEATEKIVNNEVTASEEFTNMGISASQLTILLDNEVISSPTVSTVISGGNAQIEGNFTQEEASQLAALIRGGSLPVGLEEVQTNIVGPSLGIDSLTDSIIAALIGVALVMLIMLIFYRMPGLAADIALALYCLIFVWIIAAFGTVLTLPGIAGMILSVGMAVDANVIIFARIKEEVVKGKSIRVATSQGYKRALATVMDAQITTLIASVALYEFGSGDVRGFALTLMIGIVISIFTATVITNIFLRILAESKTFGTKKFFGIKEPAAAAAEGKEAL